MVSIIIAIIATLVIVAPISVLVANQRSRKAMEVNHWKCREQSQRYYR